MRLAVILSSSRTGSTLLGETLKQHPAVTYDEELVLPHAKEAQQAGRGLLIPAWQHVTAAILSCPTDVHLWKLQSWQHRLIPGLLDQLLENDNLHVIFLRRENLLEWFISNKVAETRRVYTKRIGDDVPDMPPFAIDPDELAFAMNEERAWWYEVSSRAVERDSSISVEYRELVEFYQPTMDRLFHFLGLKPVRVQPPMLKMQTRAPQFQVTNFHELRERFRATEFAPYGFQD